MIVMRADKQGIEAVMPAQYAEIELVCRQVEEFLARRELQFLSFAVLLGVREALTNAIRHGSALDAAKEVYFLLQCQEGRLLLTVRDQGPGFDWRQLADLPPLNLSESGRGMAILKHYFDLVQFNELGNELHLVINLDRGSCDL